ncbi:putative baseplate assembly protein [Ramlibacter sp. G-1-2-2]|uniref:Putative baseplate assembly protein n=1 Tax=Ramlibacter agri TaxID=2728837 RepID=A0A848H786_9BURK|nr:putative baseplate assembly protein [Ramlibacter agri]NML46856.1 putative baseplate assembly protein [Ramlibacter agri]
MKPACGCLTQPCGCCEGVQARTPADECNRPGLPALRYRVGTHAEFMQSMQARLSTMVVQGVGSDGQTLADFRPLQGLTTRDPADPSIALLDAWATVGDVLGFYQERIANENYLRTATERRSVLELSRLVGYTPRPGVAASVFLAYTIDDKQVAPVTLPVGTAAQSVPNPGEQPQTFETFEPLLAASEWNNLQVRMSQPPNITLQNALAIVTLQVAGTATNLRPGDKLLLLFSADGSPAVLRSVASIDTQVADQRTQVTLRPVPPGVVACVPALMKAVQALALVVDANSPGSERRSFARAKEILDAAWLAMPTLPLPVTWPQEIEWAADGTLSAAVQAIIATLLADIVAALTALGQSVNLPVTNPAEFVQKLLQPPVPQVRNSVALPRSLQQAFSPTGAPLILGGEGLGAAAKVLRPYADVSTQLLVSFVPHLASSYYTAWSGARLNPAQAPLKAVHVLRARASLFGATAARLPTYTPAGILNPQNAWTDWTMDSDETSQNAFLDQANEAIVEGSYAVAEVSGARLVLRVATASTTPRSAYGLSGQSTELGFVLPAEGAWRNAGTNTFLTGLRKTKLYVQSEPLTLLEDPLTAPIASQQITLDRLYKELVSGRWVILSGERADIAGVDGVTVSELQMISGLSHGVDPTLPGDTIHTTLVLATPPAHQYKRDTLKIYGNVVKATQGATRKETMGSGNGAQALQSFALKQPPLTFVAAPTAAGAASTLHVYVDGIEWHESDSLAALGPKSRGFVTLTDDDAGTTVVFGNGAHGARLATGVENVQAVYRSGIGAGGNVDAGQITVLQSRPLGVKEVLNPLRAAGGADKESRDLARENAPLSVMPLDRLVSVQDYEDFTRRFAGIAKALAQRTSDGRHELVYLTIAGTGDVPIDASSDLYQNLLKALREQGDADLPLRVDLRERQALVLSARIKLLPDYVWDDVVATARAALLDAFGFDRRRLGQWALLSEVIAAIQGVRGVAWVDVDSFGAVPERVWTTSTDADGTVHRTRELLTQDDILATIADIIAQAQPQNLVDRMPPSVAAFAGGLDQGALRPAEIVAFTPEVPDTLILNQVP